MIQHKVAVTSTLAVFEVAPPLQPRFLDALSPTAALLYLSGRDRLPEQARARSALRIKKEVEFERAFVKAGGLLMAGCDPTGNGSALAGFGDQRNIELLVEGGFTPAEAHSNRHVQWRQVPGLGPAHRLHRAAASRPIWWFWTETRPGRSRTSKKSG